MAAIFSCGPTTSVFTHAAVTTVAVRGGGADGGDADLGGRTIHATV
jgi:hypothetical protein